MKTKDFIKPSLCLLIILTAQQAYAESHVHPVYNSHIVMQIDSTITVKDLQALLSKKSKVKILDVRLKKDFEADPQLLPTATWQDPTHVDQWAKTLSKDSPIVVYCVHGHKVSRDVTSRLLQLGYHAQLLEGGIHAWKELGGSTIPSK